MKFQKNIVENFKVVQLDPETDFVYFGIKWQLEKTINPDLHKDNKIFLKFNIDGLPLFSSSKVEFWPILGQIYYRPSVYSPFRIGIYCGKGKPKNLDKYCANLISELNDLLDNGIEVDGKKIEVKVLSFICYLPARSFLKCTKNQTGYFGCER